MICQADVGPPRRTVNRHARIPQNSVVFDFPGVIFVIRPHPRRTFFCFRGKGAGGRGGGVV